MPRKVRACSLRVLPVYLAALRTNVVGDMLVSVVLVSMPFLYVLAVAAAPTGGRG